MPDKTHYMKNMKQHHVAAYYHISGRAVTYSIKHCLALAYLFTFILMLPWFTPGALAIPSSSMERFQMLVDTLQKRYEQTAAIAADFRQVTYAPGDPEGVRAEGKVYFKRPYLMRWDYKKPSRQVIVTSGKDVYIYEEEANQVTILPRDQLLSTEISRAFFFGKGDLRRDFKVEPPPHNIGNGGWSLCLIPKRQVLQMKMIVLTLDPDRHIVKKILIEDQMGGKTLIKFYNIKVNPKLSGALFKFVPPEGAEIYRGQ